LGSRERLIRQLAVKYGLDPEAVVSIASVEGSNALHGGVSIGDHGTSFGPFQLHAGGALPKGKGSAWAHSRAGIDYAERQMAKVAGGLHGQQAVAAISSRFERPADVPGEIAKAMQFYGGGSGAPATGLGGPQIGSQGRTGAVQTLSQDALRSMAASALMQPGGINASSLMSLATARRQSDAMGDLGSQAGTKFEIDHNEPLSPNTGGVVKAAQQYLGTKYVWGGTSPKGFDCSGFVQYLYAQQGIKLPRTTYEQIKVGKKVGLNGLQPGDVIFFSKNGDVHHEGLYIGHGQFIHAPHTGDVVKISSLSDPYYSSQFAGGRRMTK
jgi:cell wall-associated NlpC family hydrolase